MIGIFVFMTNRRAVREWEVWLTDPLQPDFVIYSDPLRQRHRHRIPARKFNFVNISISILSRPIFLLTTYRSIKIL